MTKPKPPKVSLDRTGGPDPLPDVQQWVAAFRFGAASLMNLLTTFEFHIEHGISMGYEFSNEAGRCYITARAVVDAIRNGDVVNIRAPMVNTGDVQ